MNNNIKKITKIVAIGCLSLSLAACAPIYQIEPDNTKTTETNVDENKIVETDIQEIEKTEETKETKVDVIEPEVEEKEVEEKEAEVDVIAPEIEETDVAESEEKETEVEEKMETQEELDTVLDLTELEDNNNYKTGLVVIKSEGEYWRAVDRTGKVFRIKTNNENIKSGAVCDEATVEIDEEDPNNMSVSLDSGFYINEKTKIKDGEAKDVVSSIIQKEVVANNSQAVEINYTFKDININKIGKAIVVAEIIYTTEDENAENKEISRKIVMYGYENTWVIPGK